MFHKFCCKNMIWLFLYKLLQCGFLGTEHFDPFLNLFINSNFLTAIGFMQFSQTAFGFASCNRINIDIFFSVNHIDIVDINSTFQCHQRGVKSMNRIGTLHNKKIICPVGRIYLNSSSSHLGIGTGFCTFFQIGQIRDIDHTFSADIKSKCNIFRITESTIISSAEQHIVSGNTGKAVAVFLPDKFYTSVLSDTVPVGSPIFCIRTFDPVVAVLFDCGIIGRISA